MTGVSSACVSAPAGWPLRLLCDEMLKGVGRWLRAAGYDAAIAADRASDQALVAQARAEGRILLTRDRRLAALAGGACTLILASERLDQAARELKDLGIDWLQAPFTRCLVDNAPLAPAHAEGLAVVPASARRDDGPVLTCPKCARVYWPGSHVRRMRARLERWQTL
jgi:uncharacterized protein with PIN domain